MTAAALRRAACRSPFGSASNWLRLCVVGVGIGYLLDTWLDTKPWFLVGFFFVGAAAGVLNVLSGRELDRPWL